VLFVDADERVTPALRDEIQTVLERPEPGWWIPRDNYIFGHVTRHAAGTPIPIAPAAARPGSLRPRGPVHELAILDSPLPAGHLSASLIHLNLRNR
jgi:hypothetical protein